jgi:hypothetical protein
MFAGLLGANYYLVPVGEFPSDFNNLRGKILSGNSVISK